MPTISDDDARIRLQALTSWELADRSIRRELTFVGFPDAIAFVARLAFDLEASDHHPDVLIRYNRVTLTFTTHSAGGLTEKDFAGAAAADVLAGTMGGR